MFRQHWFLLNPAEFDNKVAGKRSRLFGKRDYKNQIIASVLKG